MLFQTKVLLFVKLPLFFFYYQAQFPSGVSENILLPICVNTQSTVFFYFLFSSHKSRVFYANRHYYTKGQYLFI